MKQPNDIGNNKDLALYRVDIAKDDLRSAKILLDADEYRGANNRAYYSICHAINAIHALSGKSYKKHKDAIANFNKEYVKTEIFPRKIGRSITEAEGIRHASDYDDFYIANKDEAKDLIDTAEKLIELIEKYIDKIEK